MDLTAYGCKAQEKVVHIQNEAIRRSPRNKVTGQKRSHKDGNDKEKLHEDVM